MSRQPKGAEWLWHPKVVGLYKLVLQSSESNSTGRDAAVGALQNITAGETRVRPRTSKSRVPALLLKVAISHKACGLFRPGSKWASVLSGVVLEQERMLPILLDLLDTSNDMELKPLTGLLRNLARHCSNKDHMGGWWKNGPGAFGLEQRRSFPIRLFSVFAATNVVKVLVSKLPGDGHQKTPSSEVVVNICGALNNLVASSSLAARDISYFNGLPKLVGIKTSHDNR